MGGFEGEEGGLSVGVLKTGLCGEQRPEQLDGAPGDPPQGGNGRQAAVGQGRAFQRLIIRKGQGALGNEDKDSLSINAIGEEGEQSFDTRSSFAGAGGALQKGRSVQRKAGDGNLFFGELCGMT